MLNIRIVSLALGIWASVSFVVCVLWGLATPEALHMHAFLEILLPGFEWLTAASALLGLIESFLFGIYAGVVYVIPYNMLVRRFGAAGAGQG